MMQNGLRESKPGRCQELHTEYTLGVGSYFRMCDAMVHAIGFELGPVVRAWFQERGVVVPGSWPVHLMSWISARDETGIVVSDFIELTTETKSVANPLDFNRNPIVKASRRQLYLICRPTGDAAQAILRPLRDSHALASNRDYLVGTPAQLVEWCGNLRTRDDSDVYLNFFDYCSDQSLEESLECQLLP